MTDPRRAASGKGGALTREFRELTERCRDLERQLETVSFERNGYYGEWRNVRSQLDEIHGSRMWRFWMASIAIRRTARLTLGVAAGRASEIAGSLRRWVRGPGNAPSGAAGGSGGQAATDPAASDQSVDPTTSPSSLSGARPLRPDAPGPAPRDATGASGSAASAGPAVRAESQGGSLCGEGRSRVATGGSGFVELLTSANPKLHYDEHNQPVSWGIDADVLREIDATIERGSRTLETGAGLSTVLFAAKACRHTVVCPDQRHLQSIVTFCNKNGISLDMVEMVAERSELYLPRVVGLDLDAALIDGRHAFPSPFIDWFYIASNLRIGGVLIVDDTPIFTGRVLDEFLSEDPHWELLRRFPRTSFFAKRSADVHGQEWNQQPYIRRLSS